MSIKDQEGAIAAAQAAVENHPMDAERYVELGIAYFHSEQFDGAKTAFQQAAALDPNSADAYNWIGRVYYKLGLGQQAVEAYEHAIALNPHHINSYYGLGILYSTKIGDYEAAVAAFQRGLEQNPSEAFLIASLGSTYARMGRFDEAIATLHEATELDPDNTFAFGWLSIVYLYQKRDDEVIASCQREIAVAESNNPRRVLGYVYDRLGRYDEAIAQLEQAVALEPQDYEARGALSKAYRTVGRQQGADEQYAIAREMAAQDNEYGQACLEAVTGSVEQALKLLEVALTQGQLQPGWARIDPEFTCLTDEPQFKALIAEHEHRGKVHDR